MRPPEQLQAWSLPAPLSQQYLRRHVRPARAWRLRREPRAGPPPVPKPRPPAARARRPARAAGRDETAALPRRLRSRQGPQRTPPSHPAPFPGQRRQHQQPPWLAVRRRPGRDRFHPGIRRRRGCRFCRDNACGRLACWRPGFTTFDARQAPPNRPRQRRHHDFFRASRALISCGTTSKRSPTTPKSAISKIGASESLLMATIVFAVCMPARC